MERYSTSSGDTIAIEADDPGIRVSTALAVTVHAVDAGGRADGVITTDAHADAIHDLFRRGATFRIDVDPDDANRRTFAECTLLSSSGKWIGRCASSADDRDG